MIYLVADIHGNIRLNNLKQNVGQMNLTKNDFLIILGDAGIVWVKEEHRALDYYKELPCQVLFLDGNHENFTLLNAYPVEEWNNGLVHRIASNIIYLMRGEIYDIAKQSFFVFGGGFSAKKLTNTSPVYIWEEEMPCSKEYDNALMNLSKHGNKADYILTHVGTSSVLRQQGIRISAEEIKLNDFLDEVAVSTSFKNWYFGHHHKDFTSGQYRCIYDGFCRVGESNETI